MMKRIAVDTNAVLSFLTDRDAAQQEKVADLFGRAADGQHVLVLQQSVIGECVYVMTAVYGATAGKTRATLRDLLEQPGVVTLDALDWAAVWELWPGRLEDFGDACIAAAGRAGGYDELATFDGKFARRARRLGIATYW